REIDLHDEQTLDLEYEPDPGGVVSIHLSDSSCARTYREDATIELEGDTCGPFVTYNEWVHDCDDCHDLGDAIADALFGPKQSWLSTSGVIVVDYDPKEE